VSEYSHEMAVADGVNVGYNVFIDTKITKKVAKIWMGEYVEHRERQSRRKILGNCQDEDIEYSLNSNWIKI
jgi:type I restriction enzyme R subunit